MVFNIKLFYDSKTNNSQPHLNKLQMLVSFESECD